ncbi:MAG: FR47-like protein [Actinomycetota bacterium]|nr:FR47-like protein [Actinomycetota bacterium]
MGVPEHVIRYWQAQDAFLDSREATWWGAVVTDRRFPRVWDANYARVDREAPDLTMNEIAEALIPALRAAGAETFHVVSFVADHTTALMDELAGAGHTLSWDLVMDLDVERLLPADPSIQVEQLSPGDELWDIVRATFPLFGGYVADAGEDLLRIESTVMAAGGKRWFGVRDADGSVLSVVAVQSLAGVGYIDDVATFPAARGLGLASELTLAACRTVLEEGARHVWLMADPDQDAVRRMYGRLGFKDAGHLASTKGPLP